MPKEGRNEGEREAQHDPHRKPRRSSRAGLALTLRAAPLLRARHLADPYSVLVPVVQHAVGIEPVAACTPRLLVEPIERFLVVRARSACVSGAAAARRTHRHLQIGKRWFRDSFMMQMGQVPTYGVMYDKADVALVDA